jgi:hypothetical protein
MVCVVADALFEGGVRCFTSAVAFNDCSSAGFQGCHPHQAHAGDMCGIEPVPLPTPIILFACSYAVVTGDGRTGNGRN